MSQTATSSEETSRFVDVPPPLLTGTCEVCNEAVSLTGRGWVHDATGAAMDGGHWAWPLRGMVKEAERAEVAPQASAAAFW